MNNDNSTYLIQSETSSSPKNPPEKDRPVKETIQEISESLIDKRYIKKHPSAKVINHAKK
jgi:hypothetical protein